MKKLPFPQNKNLKLQHSSGAGENEHVSYFYTSFIPVLNQPLSSNRYYAISTRGKLEGKAYTSSTEDFQTCCFCSYIADIPPKPFSPTNTYQQYELRRRTGIFNSYGGFVAKAIAPDGFAPTFLAKEGWDVSKKAPRNFHLDEAPGLDSELRACLPVFNFELSDTSSKPAVVVGKWYCPFMFVKEGSLTLKDQMSSTRCYEMTLEQKWEQIFACDHDYSEGNTSVVVDVSVENEFVEIGGNDLGGVHEERDVANGVMWYRSYNKVGGECSIGLSLAILERVKWEQHRFGWNGGNERNVRVKKVEEYEGT